MKFLFVLLVIIAACSFKKNQLKNQTQNGHTELYSEPHLPKEFNNEQLKRVVIASTNDIHGHYEPHQISFSDTHHKGDQTVKVGGVDFISSYFKILREQYGQILLLDSGDIFSKEASEVQFVSDFYSQFGYDAITIGLQDFNMKLPKKFQNSSDFFKDFAAQSKVPVLLSNLYELKSARVVEWQGTLPYLIREVNGVKIGIIGLIPDDIVEQTPVDNRLGLFVESMLQSTMKHARLLKSLGADMIVVMSHQGLNCGQNVSEEFKLPLSKVNFEPEKKNMCDLSSAMGEYIKRLPPHLVDVFIGGRTHTKMANFVNTTLVMGGFEDGKSFSYAEFFVDAKTKKVSKDKTVVHQPVMFCQEFFKETQDCYSEDPSVDHKSRVPAQFLGQEIKADSSLDQKFHFYLKTKVQTSLNKTKNPQTTLGLYDGNIIYQTSGSQDSKLILVDLTGPELSDILEDDYNQGDAKSWIPSPFKVQGEALSLSIQGEPISAQASYKVLISIDDLQRHGQLKKFITRSSNKSLNHVSWNEPTASHDEISTSMSASEAVR